VDQSGDGQGAGRNRMDSAADEKISANPRKQK
jgi:hypothetical protein